jgi:hypothetical protein
VKCLALAVLLCAASAFAGPPDLIPIDRRFVVFEPAAFQQAYHRTLVDVLLRGSSRRACEAVVVASFEREWAVYVQETAVGGQEVVCTVMNQQLHGRVWQEAERSAGSEQDQAALRALSGVSKETTRFRAPLTATTASLLERTWAALLERARVPVDPPRCIDGTSYYLFQWRPDQGGRGGTGRCPSKGSPTLVMLGLLSDLRRTAGSSEPDLLRQDMALARKATALLLDLAADDRKPR